MDSDSLNHVFNKDSFASFASTARDSFSSSPQEANDWYGNTRLHSAFGVSAVNLHDIKVLLRDNSSLASQRNQFGRIALHYALDRSRCNFKGVALLLSSYPAGPGIEDFEGVTPYDLAIRWRHPRKVRLLLLESCPDCCRETGEYVKLKFGSIIGTLAQWALEQRRSIYSHEESFCEEESQAENFTTDS